MTGRRTGSIRVPLTPRCPKCGADRVSPLVCPRCRTVENVSADAYALFGLTRSWAVEPQELEDRYAAVIPLLDPDSPAAAALSDARRLLLDPLARGRYLIELHGGDTSLKSVESSSEFLTDVMELSRAAEEAVGQRDEAKLAGVIGEAEEKLGSFIMAAGQSFTRLERALVDEVTSAAEALAGASYWGNLVDELRDRKARLEKERSAARLARKERVEP
jgi:DnaJ-domain-containing protein 1